MILTRLVRRSLQQQSPSNGDGSSGSSRSLFADSKGKSQELIQQEETVHYTAPDSNATRVNAHAQSPSGTMKIEFVKQKTETLIRLTYLLQAGVQQWYHPNPSTPYKQTRFAGGYLEDTPQGLKLLDRLKRAFESGLTFAPQQHQPQENYSKWCNVIPHCAQKPSSSDNSAAAAAFKIFAASCHAVLDALRVPGSPSKRHLIATTSDAESSTSSSSSCPRLEAFTNEQIHYNKGEVAAAEMAGKTACGSSGTMTIRLSHHTIQVTFNMQQSRAEEESTTTVMIHSCLPFSIQGRKLLTRIKFAWSRGLLLSTTTVASRRDVLHNVVSYHLLAGCATKQAVERCNKALDRLEVPDASSCLNLGNISQQQDRLLAVVATAA